MAWFALIPMAISAVGTMKGGQDADAAAQYNAEVSRQTSEEQARRDEIQARMVIGSDRANYGASGVQLEGSPLDVLQQSAKTAELDRLTTLYAGATQSAAYKAAGEAAKTSAMFSAAGQLAEGAGKAYGGSGGAAKSTPSSSLSGGGGSYMDAGTTLQRIG